MSNNATQAVSAAPVVTDQSKYLIHSRVGILGILDTLHEAGSLVTAYFGAGNDFLLTSIATVRPDQSEVIMDYGADSAANQRALQARRITFVAAHDRIKIQFVATSVTKVRYGGRDAFGIPIPTELLRLQRREYFRITTPLSRPLKCLIAPQSPAVPGPTEATIIDISCGGVALLDSSEPGNIETGVCFRGCRIILPDAGTVTADILVKSVFDVTLKSGTKHKHVGCEFVGMPERERAVIQRYINKVERERRSRTAG